MKNKSWYKNIHWIPLCILVVALAGIYFILILFRVCVEWVAIITALIIGVLGIFQDGIRRLFKNPRLKICFELKSPYCHKVPVAEDGSPVCERYYIRIKVENIGNYPLEEIEVMAINLKEKIDGKKFRKLDYFIPLNLKWAHYGIPLMSKIQPNLFKYISLGYFTKSDEKSLKPFIIREVSKTVFVLSTAPQPYSGEHILFPGHFYEIELKVAANNLKPKVITFNLQIKKDDWHDDEKKVFEEYIFAELVKNN